MSALVDFLRRERQVLVGYVRRRLDDAVGQDAEDVVQDVIVALFSRPASAVSVEDAAAYVYRALRNRIVDRYRRRRETDVLPETQAAPDSDPQRETERAEMLEGVFEAIDELGEDEKAVLMQTEFEGRSFRELAEEWGVPVGTLLARKSRALKKVKERLAGRF